VDVGGTVTKGGNYGEGLENFEISVPTDGRCLYVNCGKKVLRSGRVINRLEHCEKFEKLEGKDYRKHILGANPPYATMPCISADDGSLWDIPRIRMAGEPDEQEARRLAEMVERLIMGKAWKKRQLNLTQKERRF